LVVARLGESRTVLVAHASGDRGSYRAPDGVGASAIAGPAVPNGISRAKVVRPDAPATTGPERPLALNHSKGTPVMAYHDPYPQRPAPDQFVRRWLFITACVAALMLFWQLLPAIEAWFSPREAAERTVTPRGDLAADEKATIELFEKSRASVVYITTSQLVRNAWTRNVFSVPRGTGSGFIGDDACPVVANFHVIKGASKATVTLGDGRDHQAVLVGVCPACGIAVLKRGVGFQRPPAVPIGTS